MIPVEIDAILIHYIVHVPGIEVHIADTLSRAPLKDSAQDPFKGEVEVYVNMIVNSLPASEGKLQQLGDRQAEDQDCSQLIAYCKTSKVQWTATLKYTIKGMS